MHALSTQLDTCTAVLERHVKQENLLFLWARGARYTIIHIAESYSYTAQKG